MKAHYRIFRLPKPVHSLRHINPVRAPFHFVKMNFNIIAPSTPTSFKCSLSLGSPYQNPVCTSTVSLPQAAPLLRSWVRIPPGAWIFVCCECRVLSGRSLCDELITCPEESCRLWCVVVCDLETSRTGAPYIYLTLVA